MKNKTIFWVIVGFGCFFLSFWGIGYSIKTPISKQTTSKPTPRSVYGYSEGSVEFNAITLVGFDDGNKLPDKNDVRINRVIFLLNSIIAKTEEPPEKVSIAIDVMSKHLRKDFGKVVSRQQILEETKLVFDEVKKPSPIQKTSDAMVLILAKYGK